MLDTLIYTDATADESLTGSPGFQFVAHSAGATRVDEGVVREQLQHSVPANLLADNWEQHPATCAYIRVDGRMYLSRGLSTGATLGGRPGNQLTVTLMTSDPYDIIPLCPAQLYSSPSWDFGRPITQDLPGWATPLEISEDFDVPALHDMVVNDPWAITILPQVLTMLEQTQVKPRARLFIRHPDQRLVMRWLALLSRLLGPEAALGLEFRVFSSDPLRTNAHVLGVHPLINPDLTASTAESSGANVLDLERRELSKIEPSEAAKRHAHWFISGDPYDALEAIESSRRWSQCVEPGDAAALAGLVIMKSDRSEADQQVLRISLDAIARLTQCDEVDALEIYSEEFGDLVLSCPPPSSTELELFDAAIWAVAVGGQNDLAQDLALAALGWTTTQPELLAEWARIAHPTTKVQWLSDDVRTRAAGMLATSLNSTDSGSLAATFVLAKVLDTGISPDAMKTPVAVLADQWVTNPGLSTMACDWVHADAVVDQLVLNLDAKLTAGDDLVTKALLAGSWDWLAPVPWQIDQHDLLSRWFAARELQHADQHGRLEVLKIAQTVLPNHAWRLLLPTASGLNPEEVVGWIGAHGILDPNLGLEVEEILRDTSRYPKWQRNGGERVLHAIGNLDTVVPGTLKVAADEQKVILELFERAARDKDQPLNTALGSLGRQFPGRLNSLYMERITRVVLELQDTQSAVALADGDGRDVVIGNVRDRLVGELRKPTPSAMLSAIRLLNPALGRPWTNAAKEALDIIWDDRNAERLRNRLLASVEGRLNRSQRAWLIGYLEAQSKGRFVRGTVRGAKSIFGSKDK